MAKYLIGILILLITCFRGEKSSILQIYSAPGEIKPSGNFSVRIRSRDGSWRAAFVYQSKSSLDSTEDVSWINFSFKGEIKIEITSLNSEIKSAVVRPKPFQIKPVIKNKKIILNLDNPNHYVLEINGDKKHPLLIFANPPESSPTYSSDKDVITFKSGLHTIGDKYPLKSNTIYYLEGGAYLKGSFYGKDSVENVIITGRGIIDAGYQKYQHPSQGLVSGILFEDGRNILIEGVTVLNSGNFLVKLQVKKPGTMFEVRNIKLLGWNRNTDGIHVSDMDWNDNPIVGNAENTSVRIVSSFIRANDDAVLICDGVSNSEIADCVFWDNGGGATFCLSWGAHNNVNRAMVRDCYVIHKEGSNPVFRAQHAGEAVIQNVVFRNIFIEGDVETLLGLSILNHRYDRDPGHGSIKNIQFANIIVEGRYKTGWLKGFDSAYCIKGIYFENLYSEGKPISSIEESKFIVNNFASGVKFSLSNYSGYNFK